MNERQKLIEELENEISRTKIEERNAFMDGNEKLGFCLNGVASGLKLAIEKIKAGERE